MGVALNCNGFAVTAKCDALNLIEVTLKSTNI